MFNDVEIDKKAQEIYMCYKKEKEKLTFIMQKRYTVGKAAVDIEDQMINQQYISMEKGDVLLTEYQIKDTNSKIISAEFEYDQTWYCIYGQIGKDEMKKVINNLIFF